MTKRAPILAAAIIAAVFVLGAAAPFLQVEIYQSGYGLRGPSTNLFSANSNNLNRSIDHSSRQPAAAALSNLAANPNLYQATNAQLTIDANNTGGSATNFRAGDGAFKTVQTNWVTGLVSDIANILSAIAGKQPASAELTNLANNPNLYQATNANLTTLAGGNGSTLTTGIQGSAITTGTIDTNRLPATIVLFDRAQTFTAPQTFTGPVTLGNFYGLGGFTSSNFWNTPGAMTEWEVYRADFRGNTAASSENVAGLSGTATGSGTRNAVAGSAGHPGVVTISSAIQGAATGQNESWLQNTSALLTKDNWWACVFNTANTNGVQHAIGMTLSTSNADPTDGSRLIATNGIAVFQNLNNSTKANSGAFSLAANQWYFAFSFHTNSQPDAVFYIYKGDGTLVTNTLVAGYPTNRLCGFAAGAWGIASPATNSATALLTIDDMAVGFKVSGNR